MNGSWMNLKRTIDYGPQFPFQLELTMVNEVKTKLTAKLQLELPKCLGVSHNSFPKFHSVKIV